MTAMAARGQSRGSDPAPAGVAGPSSTTRKRSTRSSSASSTSATAAGAASVSATPFRRCSIPSTVIDRRGRWRRQASILGGRRPLLPLRHVLHDEVSVRAAASVERRLSASDAAREGRARATGAVAARSHARGHRGSRKFRRHSDRRRHRQCGESLRARAQRAREGAGRASRRARCRNIIRAPRASGSSISDAATPRREPADATRGKVALFVTCYGNRNEPAAR